MDVINLVSRDHARSPVQWSGEKFGGFSTVEPWTRVNDNYKEINVQNQLEDQDSILQFYKQSLKLRKQFKELLIYGTFEILDYDNKRLFTYVKKSPISNSPQAYVVLNFSVDAVKFEKLVDGDFKLVHANVSKKDLQEDTLSPYEGRIYIVD